MRRRIALLAALLLAVARPSARAQELAAQIPFAKDWSDAAQRARDGQKLVLAIVQIYPGLAIPADTVIRPFLEQELLDLLRERFVPLLVRAIDEVPFAAPERYGMGPHAFGASALVVTADGDVVADTFVAGSSPAWLDEFLRGVLAERGEDAWDGAAIADPLARAEAFARRGELDEARAALAGIATAPACLLRARLARRLRDGAAALRELDQAAALPLVPQLEAEVEIERALVAAGTGDVAGARAAFARALAAAPKGPRAAEVVVQLGALAWGEQDYAAARRIFGELVRDYPGTLWAQLAEAQLADPGFEAGISVDPRWPSDALIDASALAPPAPPMPVNAAAADAAAEQGLERLLADQQPDGSWIAGTDLATYRVIRPDALKVAVTAIAAQSLLPERAQPRVDAALRRALPWLLAQSRRARELAAPREAMDYWPWAWTYLLAFLADAVAQRAVPLAELAGEPELLLADLAARQQSGGGWTYLVATDPAALDRPLQVSISFVTGAVVAALQRAKAAGIAVPPELHERALHCLEQMSPVGGTFDYMIAHDAPGQLRPVQWIGASGRDAFLNHLLEREGRRRPEVVGKALLRLRDHLHELAREQGKTLMHCGPEALGSHYVFFDYVNVARVLAESAAAPALPDDGAAKLRRELLGCVLAARLRDGSFVDNPLLGRAYGTAMALQALRFLRVAAAPQTPPPSAPPFERVVLDEHVGVGYGVAVADVDGDGHRDVILVDQHEVRWYRAPKFEPRLLCGQLTPNDHVCVAARDVTGDGVAEIAIGAGWNPGDTVGSGATFRLEPGVDRFAPWTPVVLPHEPTVHRMKWVRARDDHGAPAAELVVLPLHGRGNVDAEGDGVRIFEHRPPRAGATDWTLQPFETPLHQTHNLDVVEWDGDADEELLLAAREGIYLCDRRDGRWLASQLIGDALGAPGFRGASEVRLGRFANGRRFLATIEPFHGNALVAYVEPAREGEAWTRAVLDETLVEGHALACGDLSGRGDDTIVVGWRKPDASGKTGIRLFSPASVDPSRFESSTLDERIACEDLVLADVHEDGRLDVVASGRDSHDLVLFLNRGPVRPEPPHAERDPEPKREAKLPRAPLDRARLAAIDGVVAEAIAQGKMAGCVVAIGRSDGLCFLRAFGDRALVPERLPMTVDALFDLASLTKPLATATSVALLADEGKLALDDPLRCHLPEFAASPSSGLVTLRRCLEHTAGFVPDNDLADYQSGVDVAWQRLLAQAPASEPGSQFVYSDVGYELLGRVVERASGRSLDDYARVRIFAPLRMDATGFLPDAPLRARAAPTEPRDGALLQGVVHDPRSALLGGVAGHAGLFSTAADLARYARMILGGGELDGVRVLTPRALALLTTAEALPGGTLRTPGFDVASRFSSNRGELMTARAFGHGGFTGTGLWIDPGIDLFVIFLSSRLHAALPAGTAGASAPDGKGVVNPLIGRIGTIAAAAVGRPARVVRLGIDVLRDERFARLKGRRVGLVTNPSGRASDGRSTIELLASDAARAAGVELVTLFTPEHGLDGLRDAAVEDGVEPATGLPVHSLYGATRKPTPSMLAGIDTLVFDVQDAGARCYTYEATLALCIEAAAEHGLRVVVLDRPDPIDGETIEGPLPDPGRESFTCCHPLPFRHGMTIGELARLFAGERIPTTVGPGRAASFSLDVVAMEGWRRCDRFDDTGLSWVNPSPNLRTQDALLLYPGLVLFEPTNLSVGRGTELPFEQIGAPWLDAPALAADLANLAGLRVTAVEFTPASSKFAGERCRGLRFEITDRVALAPMRAALEVAVALARRHPDAWELSKVDALLCSNSTIAALRAGASAAEIEAAWRADGDAFRAHRAQWLLYR